MGKLTTVTLLSACQFRFVLLNMFVIAGLRFYLQVVGKKYIRLYSASLSDDLYPHTESMLGNSSQVPMLLSSISLCTKTMSDTTVNDIDACFCSVLYCFMFA